MLLYTVFIREGTVSIVTKARIAERVTRIHSTVMRVPKNLPAWSSSRIDGVMIYRRRVGTHRLALLCPEKRTHPQRETDVLQQRWTIFHEPIGIVTDQFAFFLQEIPSSNAIKMGRIMQAAGHE